MARGQADFGAYAVKEVSASVSDMGEVAARLGSIVTYDKRGTVIDFDNFEEPLLRWIESLPGGTCHIRLDSTNAKSGSQSVNLHTDNVLNRAVSIYKNIPILKSKQLGIEISFSKLSDDTDLIFETEFDDQITYSYPYLKLDPSAKTISVWNNTAAWQVVVEDIYLYPHEFCWHTLKIVMDFNTGKYVRLMFDQWEYDISAISFQTQASGGDAWWQIWLKIRNRATTGGDCWLDDLVLTQAEP